MEPLGKYLDDQANQWLAAAPEHQADLWRELVHPEFRGLVRACRLASAERPHAVDAWLGRYGLLTNDRLLAFAGRGPVLDAIRAHLLCVQMARNPLHWTQLQRIDARALDRLEAETHLPRPLLRDIARELCGQPPLRGVTQELTSVLLIDKSTPKDGGFTTNLTFEAIEPGAGQLYPSPEMSLLHFDEDFKNSVVVGIGYARGHGGWPGEQADVRWNLTTRERDKPLPVSIGGPSASAAFGALLIALVASR
jgi:hypothetical protein